MSRLPNFATDADQWGAILNDFLSVAHNADGTLRLVSTAEVDFGPTPTGPKQFTVTDTRILPTHMLHVSQSGSPPTTGFGGEAEWDPMVFSAVAGTGAFTVSATPLAGLVVGRFKLAYTFSVPVGIS